MIVKGLCLQQAQFPQIRLLQVQPKKRDRPAAAVNGAAGS